MRHELIGDTWLGTGGSRLTLADLAGRIVLLDFWTLCCVNCHHVLAELRPIEEKFADVLTVIGVHSPKFEHEKQPDAVLAAMHRHGITHPILNDPNLQTWQAYGVRAWPTLVLLDTRGEIAATFSGEGHGHAIEIRIEELIARGEADGTLRRGRDPFIAPDEVSTPYLQPGKAHVLRDGRLVVSDSGRHRLVLATVDEPNDPIAFVGTGRRGFADGSDPEFNEPYGVAQLPDDIAAQVGYDIVIADTANHLLRGLHFESGDVRTIAGTGAQWMHGDPTSGPARDVPLSTPWDVAWDGELIVIAMAGEHRIWQFDPVTSVVSVTAGTTNEGMVDGRLEDAWFAQSSAIVSSNDRLWVIDAETSALREIHDGQVRTRIGKGLFDFGFIDGPANEALLQHPLGLAVLTDGRIVIADSYNGAIRVFDPSTDQVSTLLRDLAEPSDVLVHPDGTHLLVVESAAGRVSTHHLAPAGSVHGQVMRTSRPALDVHAGEIVIEVRFDPPPGEKRDDRYGPATQLVVSASPSSLIRSGAGTSTDLVRTIVIDEHATSGVLHIAAKGASCDIPSADQPYPACRMHQQDWGIPIRVTANGERRIVLPLSG